MVQLKHGGIVKKNDALQVTPKYMRCLEGVDTVSLSAS